VPNYDLPNPAPEPLRGVQGLTVTEQPSLAYLWVGMNTEKAPLNDLRVRQAIRLGLDVDQMLLLVGWAGRHPSDVVLEITERELVLDIARLGEVLASYRAHGFRFAVDDVGDGHSTLEMLAAAVPEFLKISGRLTRGAAEVGPRSAIRAVVAFAAECGARVVAEGIETPAHLELMRELGVELGQGFGLERPAVASAWS